MKKQLERCGEEKIIILSQGELKHDTLRKMNELYQKKNIWMIANLDKV